MSNEIFELFKSKANFDAAKSIHDNFDKFNFQLKDSCYKDVKTKWIAENDIVENNHLFLFDYRDYKFYAKVSDEGDQLHLDIFPGKEKWAHANDTEISIIRTIAKSYNKISKSYQNNNYTIWIYFENNIENIPHEVKVNLIEDAYRIEWVEKIIEECDIFLKFLINEIEKDTRITNEISFNLELKEKLK